MTDLREQILNRLLAIAEDVDGIENAYRNVSGPIGEDSRPAISIFDGEEIAEEGDISFTRSRPPNSPNLITMTPGIHILLSAEAENVGSNLNALRVNFLKAILNDETLATLAYVNDGGQIRYGGCTTYTEPGRKMEGDMMIIISIIYPLIPTSL
jgi:hypothetical protein